MVDFDEYSDIIDSRDIIERIEELEEGIEFIDLFPMDNDEIEELAVLKKLVEDINGSSYDDASDGVTLIRDSYFEDYAREFASDKGVINDDKESRWPLYHIDWEAAAADLQQDYTEVVYNGVIYWLR